MGKRIETTVTAGHNGGIHDVREYKKACSMLDNHTFTNAQLWHLVLTNLKEEDRFVEDRKAHKEALQQVVDKLRDSGMEVEWKAAYELCPTKGWHRHVFLLIESKNHKPAGILRYRPDGWLVKHLAGYGLGFHLARPKNAIHRTSKGFPKKYAYVPKNPGPVLDNCKDWISYIYKVRTKAGVIGSIYSSSRKKTTKAKQEPAQAIQPEQAKQATTNQPTIKEQPLTTMTPAAHKYIASLYETFIDKGLDLEDIRRALLTHGIRRNIYQIEFDLDHRYCFAGYAASHQPAPRLTLAQLQAKETDQRTSARKGMIRLPNGRYVRPTAPAAA